MARKKDLAGLAALGALGMMLSKKGDSGSITGDDQYNPDVKQRGPDLGAIYAEDGSLSKLRRNTETGDLYSPDEAVTRPSSGSRTPTRPMRDDQYNPDVKQGRIAGQGGPRGTRYSGNVTGNPGGSYDAEMPRVTEDGRPLVDPERRKNYGMLESIKGYYSGNPFTAASAKREALNAMNATAGLSIPGFIGEASQATQAGNRAAKAADVAEKGREAVGNPLLWAQGPKAMAKEQKAINAARRAEERANRINKPLSELDTTGGAIGYRKGGKTKKMASGGSVKMSASRRGDGIAQRGKTRGVMR